jgi:hypothetical protein
MDDSNSTTNTLDINPEMMTAQSDIPVLTPISPLATPATNTGIIDITPGAPEVSFGEPKSQHIDIAPVSPSINTLDITPEIVQSSPDSPVIEITSPAVDILPPTTSEEPVVLNPLYEDPDTVKLVK